MGRTVGQVVALTAAQEELLDAVVLANDNHSLTIETVDAEAEAFKKRALQATADRLRIAVYNAKQGNVPMTQITKRGLGVKNTAKAYGLLNEERARRGELEPDETPESFAHERERVSTPRMAERKFILNSDGTVSVRYPGFVTTSKDPEYPDTLVGRVERDETKASGWSVIEDESDVISKVGSREHVLPGFLRWELDRPYQPGELGTLGQHLDAFVGDE